MKTLLSLSLTVAALALGSAPVRAQPQGDSRQLVVSYADLDLSTQRGVRILDQRLRFAARTACGPTSDADPAGKNDARDCRAQTLAQARAQRDTALAERLSSVQVQMAASR